MDETGLIQGIRAHGLIFGIAKKRKTFKKDPGRREWTTIIEYVSAGGQHLQPLVIFKSKDIQQQWFPDENIEEFKDWKFESSPKGWTSDDITVQWLNTVFIPQTWVLYNRSRLLIVDGYKSHITDDFIYSCFNSNIYLLFLPSYTSHILQPLDLSMFSPIKTHYCTVIKN